MLDNDHVAVADFSNKRIFYWSRTVGLTIDTNLDQRIKRKTTDEIVFDTIAIITG